MARKAKKKPVAKTSATTRLRRPRAAKAAGAGETTQGAAAAAVAPAPDYRAKIRMYRQGLGDCFLISLPRAGGSGRPFYVMIDCGVVLGTPDPGTIMNEVMENIFNTTGGEIDILIATHEHWDHLSGFIQAKEPFFDKLKIAQVWLAWTEDPKDDLAQKLMQEKARALTALRMGLSHLQLSGDSEEADELTGILEFFGAAKGATTADALRNVRAKVEEPHYCRPTDEPLVPPGSNVRFYVLGPPEDEKMLRKINPSARNKETYGLALGGFKMFMDGAGTALAEKDNGRPFDQQ